MLNGKLSLHELDDVEALCANVIRRAGLELRYHEQEECLAYLVETAWELSLHYERGDFPSRFGVYLSRSLHQRLVDWQRSRNGRTRWQFADRTYERSLPSFVELDGAFAETEVDPVERGDADSERLDAEGSIGAAAYLPPARLRSARGAQRPPSSESNRKADRSAA